MVSTYLEDLTTSCGLGNGGRPRQTMSALRLVTLSHDASGAPCAVEGSECSECHLVVWIACEQANAGAKKACHRAEDHWNTL
jgi:hypothetical protein